MKIIEVVQNTLMWEQFPMITAALSPKREQGFMGALDKLNAALQAGQIYNPVFNEVKDMVNWTLEEASDALSKKWETTNPASVYSGLYRLDISYRVVMSGAAASIKKIEKLLQPGTHIQNVPPQTLRDFLALNKEALVIATALASLKDKIIKGRQPNPNAAPKFQPGQATEESIKQVTEVLNAQIDEVVDEFKNQQAGLIVNMIQAIQKMANEQKAVPVGKISEISSYVECKYDYVRTPGVYHKAGQAPVLINSFKYLPGWKTTIQETVQRIADDVRQGYVGKNRQKLAKIIEMKGNFKEAKSTHATARRGVIESELVITFADGSRFNVRNKVVTKINQQGTLFAQFPTTFHNVVMPDGQPMKMPSEERMNTVFAVTK